MRCRIAIAACVVILLAVASCSEDGVSIEVRRGSTSATRVELYVVDDYCKSADNPDVPCPQLKTKSSPSYLEGKIYTRHDGRTLSAEVDKGGSAYFTIRANGDDTRIPLAIAVGFDANNTRVGAVMMPFEFYTTDKTRKIVTLEPIVEDRVTGTATTDGLRVETWYQDETQGVGCLAFEPRFEGRFEERTFIVPADDLDCDGIVAPNECDAIWPGHGPMDNSQVTYTCVVEERLNGGGNRCLLGDAPCIDGNGPARCEPKTTSMQMNKWCVPSELCDRICENSTDPSCLYQALKHPTTIGTEHPTYVHCSVPVQMTTTGGGSLAVCRGDVSAVLDTGVSIPANTTCRSLTIGRVIPFQLGPFMDIRSSPTQPTNSIQAVTSPPCLLVLKFAGSFAPAPSLTDVIPELLLKLDLDTGYSLLVPLVVDLALVSETDECLVANPTCVVEYTNPGQGSDESLTACAAL